MRNCRDGKVRLITVAFVCGFVFSACIFSFISDPAPAPLSPSVPMVAATQFQQSAPDVMIVKPQRLLGNSRSSESLELLPETKRPQNVDLIDMRFQPQLPLE